MLRPLYRPMRAGADGTPECGPTARTLGVRAEDLDPPGVDPVGPGMGGMSVAADDPDGLAPHRLPRELGGFGKDPLFWIDEANLVPLLQFRPDRPRVGTHGVVEPISSTALRAFQEALCNTRPAWTRQ